MSEILWGGNSASYTDPTYYTLMSVAGTASEGLQIWIGSVPETAGTNSIMVVSYGYQDWADADPAPFPMKFDQLFVNKCAMYLRIQKDLSTVDLRNQTQLLEMRLLQATWEPRPENDYQIPTVSRQVRSPYFHNKQGTIVRTRR